MDREFVARPDACGPPVHVLAVPGEAAAREDPGEARVIPAEEDDDLANVRYARRQIEVDPGPADGLPRGREQEDLETSRHGRYEPGTETNRYPSFREAGFTNGLIRIVHSIDPVPEISLRVGGEAGDGIASIGEAFCRSFSRMGLHVFGLNAYQSVIRGGHVWFQARTSSERPYSQGTASTSCTA